VVPNQLPPLDLEAEEHKFGSRLRIAFCACNGPGKNAAEGPARATAIRIVRKRLSAIFSVGNRRQGAIRIAERLYGSTLDDRPQISPNW